MPLYKKKSPFCKRPVTEKMSTLCVCSLCSWLPQDVMSNVAQLKTLSCLELTASKAHYFCKIKLPLYTSKSVKPICGGFAQRHVLTYFLIRLCDFLFPCKLPVKLKVTTNLEDTDLSK